MPEIRNHFEENQWTIKDYNNNKWTKHSKYNRHYLGKEKNFEGRNINCKGAYINAAWGRVYIMTFNEDSTDTKPYIRIDKDGFEIYK